MSQADEVKLKRYARLCGEFMEAPDLKQFLLANPEVLTNEAHMVFAAIIGRMVSENQDLARMNSEGIKQVVERLQLLRRAIDSGLETAFLLAPLSATQPIHRAPVTYVTMQIQARQGGMKTGRSILANMFGEPALLQCHFEAHMYWRNRDVVMMSTEFLISAGRDPSIEMLSGVSRQGASQALRDLHQAILRDGWEPIEPGSHWYSYRYRMSTSDLVKRYDTTVQR